jgi:hypothetical protein
MEYTYCFLFTETLPDVHYPYLKTQGIHKKTKSTEFLFNIIYKPGTTNHTKLYAVSDTALGYAEF